MKIYRVESLVEGGCSGGYQYFSSKDAAKKYVRDSLKEEREPGDEIEFREMEVLEIGKGKAEILKFLNRYASHPNNG